MSVEHILAVILVVMFVFDSLKLHRLQRELGLCEEKTLLLMEKAKALDEKERLQAELLRNREQLIESLRNRHRGELLLCAGAAYLLGVTAGRDRDFDQLVIDENADVLDQADDLYRNNVIVNYSVSRVVHMLDARRGQLAAEAMQRRTA